MLRRFSLLAVVLAFWFAASARAGIIYALDNSNDIFSFDHAHPQDILSGHAISGLAAGEQMLNIDMDPRSGQMIGLSNRSHLYTIDVNTGAATAVGNIFSPALNGIAFGFDVNPATASQARVVSATDQNLRLDNFAASALGATNIGFASGDANFGKNANLGALAFNNNVSTASTTTAFAIDPVLNVLVRLGSVNGSPNTPDSGLVSTIGPLGIDGGNLVGLDISRDGVAFAVRQPVNFFSQLYTIDLATGAATSDGQILGGLIVRDIAVDTTVNFVPEPTSLVCLLPALVLLRRRR